VHNGNNLEFENNALTLAPLALVDRIVLI